MFDVLHSHSGGSMVYVDHPKFLKLLTDRYGKDIIMAVYQDTHQKSREVGWNVWLPLSDVPALKKESKDYKSPADIALEKKMEELKEQRKADKKADREKAKEEAKAAKKAERDAAKRAKKGEQLKLNI